MIKEIQSEVNIGVVGHVDHGKTTLTSKLTGKWTDRHSDEIKQGISIRLGYADADFYLCPKCVGISAYGTKNVCALCGSKTDFIKRVSFVDAPGHETLMAVMLSGATLLNGAIVVVAANEDCPQPRTVEHILALKMHGIKNIVVSQNKIDLVSKEKAIENYNKLRSFLNEVGYQDAPIIPTSAHFDVNIDALVYSLVSKITTPEYNDKLPLKMQIVRSFDVNKPGTDLEKLVGGVLGGAVLQGTLNVGDKVWLYPGITKPIQIAIKSLNSNGITYKTVRPGGLIAVGTEIDPSYCFSDRMVGQLICSDANKPEISSKIILDYNKIDRLIEPNQNSLMVSEKIVLIIGSAAYLATIIKIKGNNELQLALDKDCVYYKNDTIAISRNVNSRWRLSGYGQIK